MPKQTTHTFWDEECAEANHGLYSFQNLLDAFCHMYNFEDHKKGEEK